MWSKFSRNVRIGNAVGYVEIVQRCGNGKLCVTLPWPSLRRLKSPWMVTFVNSPFTITFGLWIVLCSYPIARGEQKLSQFANDKNSVKTSNKKLNCCLYYWQKVRSRASEDHLDSIRELLSSHINWKFNHTDPVFYIWHFSFCQLPRPPSANLDSIRGTSWDLLLCSPL